MLKSHKIRPAYLVVNRVSLRTFWMPLVVLDLDMLIGVHDDGYEHTEYDVDEETDKEVEVDAAVPPHPAVDITHCLKCCEDVITVD